MIRSKQKIQIAILVAEAVEEEELVRAKHELNCHGIDTFLISPDGGKIKSWAMVGWGRTWTSDYSLKEVRSEDFDGLLIPGSFRNPDELGENITAVKFIRDIFYEQKCVAAICQGPLTLAQANVVRGFSLTSWPSLQPPIEQAGGVLLDKWVVIDRHLITGRIPMHLHTFTQEMIQYLEKNRENRKPVEKALMAQ